MSLSVKITLLVVSVTFIFGSILGLINYQTTVSSLTGIISERQDALAKHILNKVDRILYQKTQNIHSIAEADLFEDLLENKKEPTQIDVQNRLEEFQAFGGPWDRLFIVNNDGEIMLATNATDIGKKITDLPYASIAFKESMQGQSYNSDLVIARATNEPSIVFSYPIRSGTKLGRPILGVAIGLYSWPEIEELIDKEAGSNGTSLYLLNKKGQVISTSVLNQKYKITYQEYSNSNSSLIIEKKNQTLRIKSIDGSKNSLTTVREEEGYLDFVGNDWWLVIETPETIALGLATRQAIITTVLLVVTLLLIGSFLILLINRIILTPIQRFSTSIIANRNLGSFNKVEVNTKDELGKLAEEFNIMIEHLSGVDKAKSEFVSLASHQLRTPLSAIKWYSKMLLDGDVGKVTDKQKEYLEEIHSGNERMVSLVNALLNVARIEMGTFAVQPKKINIITICKELLEELKEEIVNKQLALKEEFKEIPDMMADPNYIRIILQNLITNAIKYTPEKGTITIKITENNTDLLISVKDTGYGVPEKSKDKIFTKLYRADNVASKDTDGTGLGLYISKSIVEQAAKGKIWFESEENKGSIFYVSIPLTGMIKREGAKGLL